jgi:diacylglycerol kinase family enzyme
MTDTLVPQQVSAEDSGESSPLGAAAGLSVAVVINAKAGAARTYDRALLKTKISEAVEKIGRLTELVFVEPRNWKRTLKALADRPDVDAVIVGGGDGSISTAGSIFVGTGKAMGLIPLGTFNLFARSLRIPIGFDAALEALPSCIIESVDVGSLTDGAGTSHVFLHHVSLGFHPRFIEIRDAIPYGSRVGKMLASLRVWGRTVTSIRRVSLAISGDLQHPRRHYYQIAVTVGSFREGIGNFPHAEDLTKGDLDVVLMPANSRVEFVVAALLAAVGRWRSNPLIEVTAVHRIRFDSRHRVLPVSLDGELMLRPLPLSFEVRPKALKVLHPPRA